MHAGPMVFVAKCPWLVRQADFIAAREDLEELAKCGTTNQRPKKVLRAAECGWIVVNPCGEPQPLANGTPASLLQFSSMQSHVAHRRR